MAKYKKKPVIIDAETYRAGMEDGIVGNGYYIPKQTDNGYPEHLMSKKNKGYLRMYDRDISEVYEDYEKGIDKSWYRPYISTLEGDMIIMPTDMIITGINGERYPCKKDIFELTYEEV